VQPHRQTETGHFDSSAPRHFGTRTVRHQETGAEVSRHFGTSFFGAELSHGHIRLVLNCLCALTRIRLRKTTRLYCKIIRIVLFKPLSTFKVVREPFQQLFSVHAFVKRDGQIKVPLAFVLMTARRCNDYVHVWKALLVALPRPPAVQAVISDFEAAIWSAVKEVFPGVTREVHYYFHYSQAVWRNVQSVSLQSAYARDEVINRVCRKTATLLPASGRHH